MTVWFRFHTRTLDNPKAQRLPPALFKTWVNLLCVAAKHNGQLPSLADVAFLMRASERDIEKSINELTSRDLLDVVDGVTSPHDWNELQYKSDVTDPTNADRQKRFRDKQKNGNVTEKTVTPTVTVTEKHRLPESDTDTDVTRLNARAKSQDLEFRLREASGWQDQTSTNLFITGEVQALIDNGADIDLDVLPVVRALAPRCRRPRSWKYFVNAIAEARDDRIRAATIVSTERPTNDRFNHRPTKQARSFTDEALAVMPPDSFESPKSFRQ